MFGGQRPLPGGGGSAPGWSKATLIQSLLQRLRGSGLGARLVRGSGYAFGIKVLATGVAFCLQVLLTRLLGPDIYGDYILSLSWMNLLFLVSCFGLNNATLRFVPAYHGRGEWGLLHGFMIRSHQIVLGSSLAMALLLAMAVYLLSPVLRPELSAVFYVACGVLPIKAILQVTGFGLLSLKRVAEGQLPMMVFRQVLMGGMLVVFVLVLNRGANASTTMWMNLATTAAMLVLSLYWLRRFVPAEAHSAAPTFSTREWVGVAFPLFLIMAFQMILVRTDTLMVGAMVNATSAGIYTIASEVSILITFGMLAVNAILAPMISELYDQGRRQELQRIVTLASRGSLLLAAPAFLLLVLGGYWVLGLFGPEFVAARGALIILSVGQLLLVLAGPVGIIMAMTGHEREAMVAVGVSAFLNIVLNATLIPFFGLYGAAIATSIAMVFRCTALGIYIRLRMDIQPMAFSRRG